MEFKTKAMASLLEQASIDNELRSKFVQFLNEFLESNKLHVSLLDNAMEMITAFDNKKRILYWNKATQQDLNMALKDVIGKEITEVFPATQSNGFIDIIDRVLDGEEINISKRAYLHKDGYYEARMTPMRDKNGEIIGGINYIRDITDKIKNEEKIEKTAALLAETQQLARIGVFEWVLKTDELYWSDEMYNIFGLDAKTVKVTPAFYLSLLFSDNDKASANEFYLNAKNNTELKPINFSRVAKRADGSKVFIYGSASYITDDTGKPVRITGFVQDITEKTIVEKELEESRYFAQQIAAASPHILYVFDINKKKNIYVNREVASVLGYTPEEINANSDILKKIIHPKDLNNAFAFLADFANADIKDNEVKSYEYKAMDANGKWRYLNTRNMVFKRDDNGRPIQIIGSVQDVTDLKQVEEDLITLNAELKRSNEDLEQFAYVASHDLKEPLRMISSYAQLLIRYVPQEDETAKLYAGFIKDGVATINRLIDDLLQYSRVGAKDKVYARVNCNQVLSEIKESLAIKLDETDTTIEYNELPEIQGIKVLVKQLFQNLIENAIKFSGNNVPHIKIACEDLAENYRFTVKDNGIGIAPEYFERIFKIFQRLHTKDKHPGSGIGLAVCRKIVDIHQGNIWLQSSPGQGSTFYFTIAKNIS